MTTAVHEIAFIDSSISDWETLLAGLNEDIEVVILDSSTDGVLQIAERLRGASGLSAIHVFSHGSSGEINLGGMVLNAGNLVDYSDALATIGNALSETGDILLYGCNVAQGEAGQQFIAQLALATGADVAASTDLTGSVALGGDWDLEYKNGDVSTALAFQPDTVDDSNILLDTLVSISVGDAVVSEDQGYAEFVVSLSAPSAQAVGVHYSSASGSAIAMGYTGGPDFALTGDQLLSFAAGETVKTVRVALVDDNVAETVESFYLNLSSPSNGVIGKSQGTATIIDNDGTAGTPVVAVSDAIVDETAGRAVFTLTLDRPGTTVVSLNVSTADGTALAGSDYQALTTQPVAFAPGEMVKTVVVNLIDDAASEPGEYFSLLLSSPVGATLPDTQAIASLGASDAATVTTPVISVGDAVVSEDQGYAEFVVSLSAPSAQAVGVHYSSASGSAIAMGYTGGPDFALTGDQLLSFAAGETVKTVRVALVDDNVAETVESFYLNLSTPTNGVIGKSQGAATILDDDGSSLPNISVADVSIDEAAGTASFVVSLSAPTGRTVSVDYATNDGTATAGLDYSATGNQSLVFVPGVTTMTVNVAITDDTLDESDESFLLNLLNPTNATIADNQASATIVDNDEASSFHFVDARIASRVDLDGDGYARQFDIEVDVAANAAGKFYIKVYEDDGVPMLDDFLCISSTFEVADPGVCNPKVKIYTDLYPGVDQLARGTAEFRLDLYDALTNLVVQTWRYDDVRPSGNLVTDVESSLDDGAVPGGVVPIYSSNPGGKATLYLDFDGDFTLKWETKIDIETPAFDLDHSPPTLSNNEIAAIHEIWARVAEYFSPFDINVTTDGADWNSWTDGFSDDRVFRIVIGGDGSWITDNNLQPEEIGKAHINGFSDWGDNTGWVWSAHTGFGGDLYKIAVEVAHEAGHGFGLVHHADYKANPPSDYYSGNRDYAPIMGVASANGLWWNGPDAKDAYGNHISQNDMDVLSANVFGYRPDDHGNSVSSATQVSFLSGLYGAFSDSGVIERINDVDYFSFWTAGGLVQLSVKAAEFFNGTASVPIGMLDPRLELYAADGRPLEVSDKVTGTGSQESISIMLTAGTYYAAVHGKGWLGEPDLTGMGADVGQYTLSMVVSPRLMGTPEADTLVGGAEDDALYGLGSDDILIGGAGNDALDGGDGLDNLIGGTGNDTYVIDRASELTTITENAGEGIDTLNIAYANTSKTAAQSISLSGTLGEIENATIAETVAVSTSVRYVLFVRTETIGTGLFNLTGNGLDNVLTGNGSTNVLDGGAGNDTLYGLGNGDTLNGSDGNDTLLAGAGGDVLTGGDGNDRFVFTSKLAGDADRITDFTEGDLLVLDGSVFTGLGAGGALTPGAFVEGTEAMPPPPMGPLQGPVLMPSAQLLYEAAQGYLYYDADGYGIGAKVLVANLTNRAALDAGDFWVV